MRRATTEAEVYSVVKNNGALPFARQPSEAQLRLYAKLVIETGARFEIGPGAWSGRSKWQMGKMIETLVKGE